MEPLSFQRLAEGVKDDTLLPSLPAAVLAAQRLVNNPESSINQIASLLEADPSMTLKLLKIANSAYYGMRRRIDSIVTALIVLGLRTTNQLLQTVGIISAFSGRVEPDFLQDLTSRSVLVAMACSVIADVAGSRFNGVEYTAGLLHDMGHAAIHVIAPEHAGLLKEMGDPFTMGCEKEQALIGADHCQVGKLLAEAWGLPDIVAECMATHHRSLDGDKKLTIPGLVRFAVYLTPCLAREEPGETAHVPLPEGHFASALSLDDILHAVKDRLDEVGEIKDLLIS